MNHDLIILIVFMFFSSLSLGFVGFGGMLISVTLGVHFFPIKWMLSMLVPVSPVGNFYILVRHRQHIDVQLLMKRLLPAMAVGLILGVVAFNNIPENTLKNVFGVMVILVSIQSLIAFRSKSSSVKKFGKVAELTSFLSAGVIHGIFATGGPLLVYALSRLELNKSEFRSTLAVVWAVMNVFLTIAYAVSGRLSVASLKGSAVLLIPLVFGLAIGEKLHHKVDERRFKLAVYIFLLVTGVSILVT